jgi:type I restriction enzyme S subunit
MKRKTAVGVIFGNCLLVPTQEHGNQFKVAAMSDMNFMEKLLDGVEVEWKPLGEVAKKISSGGTPQTGVSALVPMLQRGNARRSGVEAICIPTQERGNE